MGFLLKEKNRIICLIILLSFCFSLIPSTALSYKKKEEILFISSYNGSFPTWYNQLNGIKSVLKNDYIIDVEVMDVKRFSDDEYLEILDDLFRYKYLERKKPNALIVADDYAYNYVLSNQDLFPSNIPIIFIGVNTIENAIRADEIPNITGFVEAHSMKDTVGIAIKLTPNAKRLLIIVDDTETGQGQFSNFNKIREDFEEMIEIHPILMKDYSFAELEDLLKKLTKQDVLILLSANLDKNGQRINFNDVVDLINNNVNIPVYHLWEYGVGDGLAGGRLISHYNYGVQAAELLKNVLTGKTKIENVKVVRESQNSYIFDDRIIEKYDLDRNLLPVSTKLINKQESTAEARARYSSVTAPYLAAMLFLFFLTIGLLTNIREKNRYASQLREIAFSDKLTGLPNRIPLKNELNNQINQGVFGALIVFDIDNFKNINDTYGHSIGDEVVVEAGNILKKNLGKENFLAKTDGDEFTILYRHKTDRNEIRRYVSGLLDQINQRIIIPSGSFYITFSVGVAIYPIDGINYESIFMNAETALYKAKSLGKNLLVFYEEDFNRDLKEELTIQYELMDALKKDEFSLHFQPQYIISENRIDHYEALLRWNSAKLGSVPPDRFIRVAEEMGLITDLGKFVLEESCNFINYMAQKGKNIGVSVNVSAVELNREDYVSGVMKIIGKSGVDPSQIGLELTESIFVSNIIKTQRILEIMSDYGVNILLDDFGTGYSSLNYLRNLPVNTLKIDKSFIDKIQESDKDRIMVRAIIDIAQANGMKIVAEGVEKEDQLEILREMKCDAIQGYLISRPLPLDKIEEQVEQAIKLREGRIN